MPEEDAVRRIPIRVRKIGPWWHWYCPLCHDHSPGSRSAAGAADGGRAHLSFWHT